MRSLKNRAVAGLSAATLVAGSLFGIGSIVLADSTVPSSPTNLAITPAGKTEGPVVLTWKAPTNETIKSYQVFRFIGSGSALTNELTFIGEVDGEEESFIDEIPTEGTFQYAVIAVDEEMQASQPSAWVSVEVDQDNDGLARRDTSAPGVPEDLSLGGEFAKSRTVTLTWDEQTESDLWRFLVYRAEANDAKRLLGYVSAEGNQFTESLTADGSYVYYLRAQDSTGNVSAFSAGKRVTVDTAIPEVTITAPENGRTYTGASRLTIAATIAEDGSGYATADIDYFLDDDQLTAKYIELGDLANGVHTLRVSVTDKAGNVGWDQILFVVANAQNDPDAPQGLTAPQYNKNRAVTLRWNAPTTPGVSGYQVYRRRAGEEPGLVGATRSTTRTYTDTVTADGLYSYYVVARYSDGDEAASVPVTTTVDTVAPAIAIQAPVKTDYRQDDESITIDVAVTDATAGVAQTGIKYLLDGEVYTDAAIDLSALEEGDHTFKVEATDRAGNRSIRSVTFSVGGSTDGDDDDDEDDDSDKPVRNARLVALLAELKAEIAPGHYAALTAFAKNGNMMAFRKHVVKFTGTFISENAAKRLLEALGEANSLPGKGKGKGHGKGPKG